MLTDLKVTNEIHSSGFDKSPSMPPTQWRIQEEASQLPGWESINLLLLNIVSGSKQEAGSENFSVFFKIEGVVSNEPRPLGLYKRKSADFVSTNMCAIYPSVIEEKADAHFWPLGFC